MLPLLLLPLILLITMLPVAAQELTRCTPEVAGAVACMAERLCECDFRRGGLMTGTPDGWRWDCGILRGNCRGPAEVEQGGYDELPPGLSIDGSDNSIHLDQTTGVNGGGQQQINRSSGGPGDLRGREQPRPPRRQFVDPPSEDQPWAPVLRDVHPATPNRAN